jgi:ribosomal protein S27E
MSPRREPTPFWKVLAFWAPRRFVTPTGIDVDAFVADINSKVRQRGFVMWDRQLLTTPLGSDEPIDVIFEPESLDSPLDTPDRVAWNHEQRIYFGLDDPYQMADEGDGFTWSHIMTRIVEPYIGPDELIAGVLHGETDGRYFYCPCHSATVVYTTRRRLVCMSCGATHLVFREPLTAPQRTLLSGDEWRDYFDDDGGRRHEEVDLPIVDVRAVETAATIWSTSQWDDASHEFIFFARSSPEEIAEAIRGTEMDPSIFEEAGWQRVDTAPPPALQIMESSIDLDLAENAAHAFREGVAAFVVAYVHAHQLVTAVPQIFRAIELVLKTRLAMIDPHGLDDQPNNPTVLKRLQAGGVAVAADEVETITRLRRLRNDLQHGEATFNHRAGLALCRSGVIWIDRFADEELGLWAGDVVEGADWLAMLEIDEVAARARRIVDQRVAAYRADAEASVTTCPRCDRETMVRPHSSTGASCAYCGHVPVERDDDLDFGAGGSL